MEFWSRSLFWWTAEQFYTELTGKSVLIFPRKVTRIEAIPPSVYVSVDCASTFSFSFTWSYEKINLSMVLVVTGQLVCSYDEEFRRLYARSAVPPILSREGISVSYLRDSMALTSPNSSQLSLHQLHMNPRLMHDMRSAPDDRFNPPLLTRGLSMQDRLHQFHCPDMGNLVRGHSYGGELQKLHSTRLRMGTRDLGIPDRTGSNLMPTNRLSQQQLRHHTRYGADQNLIPFNSETSLHRWKIDSYFNESDLPPDASYDAISPMISPYSSHTGLNELQSQVIHNRSREIKSRMEEMRQKRLSLQEYAHLRQSQESLKSMYPSLERPKFGSSLRNLDKMQSVAELEPHAQNVGDMESTNQKINDPSKEGDKRERRQTYDWREPLTRTVSAAELDVKLNDPSLKLSHLQSSSIQHLRAMESLIEIPEEKDSSNSRINTSDKVVLDNGNEENHKDGIVVPEENPVKSSSPEEPQRQDEARGSHGSIGKVANSSTAVKERKKSVENIPKILNTSTGSQPATEGKSSHSERRREEPAPQRKNSVRMKVQSMLSSDEKKASKKEEKSLQRKASVRSQNPSGPSQPLRADHSQGSSGGQITKKGQSPSVSRSQHTSSPTDTERSKSAFRRSSPQRSSKRKTNPAAEQDRGSRSTLSDEGATVFQSRRERAYSRFEYLLSTESRTTSMYPSDKDRGTGPVYGRHDSGYPMYQTQSGSENKLGRFMQRVGNLIGKNK